MSSQDMHVEVDENPGPFTLLSQDLEVDRNPGPSTLSN